MPSTEKYVRVNFVDATPMNFGEFKVAYPTSGGANQQRPDDDPGYVIFYRKGQPNEYVSWCPKAEFDAVSRRADGMTFGMAIEALKRGKKVARFGWNGKRQYLSLGTEFTYVDCNGRQNAEHVTSGRAAIVFHGTIGEQVGWLTSQADMLSEDWIVLED